MNQEYKEKWIKALLSGEYVQGQNVLRRTEDNSFCCLGVLLDVYDPNGWEEDSEITVQGEEIPCKIYKDPNDTFADRGKGSMPGSVRKALDIPQREELQLMEMNDSNGNSFAEIAKYIKENL